MKRINLPDKINDNRLKKIAAKVADGIPVTNADASYMLSTNEILDLGRISNFVRTKLHGDKAYFGVNMNLNFTNICEIRCPLCAFSRDKNDKDAFSLSLELKKP
jgi:aminodeoxyfutalosine synthase